MELQSPYLEAIQAIPGTTPGEKFKTLNLIARKIAEGNKASGDSATVGLSEVPEVLMPLVQVEIANILRQPDGIIEALKSEDCVVVDRALRINWFFKGVDKNSLSVDNLVERILPYATLNTRIELIKHLAINLRTSGETKLAEDFYTYLAGKYGRAQAETLLIACSENFVWETVTKHRIILSCRSVKNLFLRYPELIIRYLKRTKPDGYGVYQDGHRIDLSQYNDFMPRLIKKHPNAFIEILEIHGTGSGIKLSNKLTETFLKNNIDALLNKPSLYTSIMPMKVITAKLTKPQFRVMFEKLFPDKPYMFRYSAIKMYLEFYPEQERISLILDSYRTVYNANLLDNHDSITPDLLCMLPVEERARQARIKLEKEPDWRANRYRIEKSWRCYLPIDESIPSIKNEISKTSAVNDRQILLEQLLYTCKANDDKDALVKVLDYITTRHKNEQIYLIHDFLEKLSTSFDLYTLGSEHWKIINDFIKFLDVKGKFTENVHVAKMILEPSIYYDLVNGLPVEDKIFMIIKMNIEGWSMSWSVLEKYPEYDRRCFEIILSMIPDKFPETNKIWNGRRIPKFCDLVGSMYNFNARNAKGNNKVEKLLLKDYPRICDMLKNILKTSEKLQPTFELQRLISLLKANELELFKDWLPIDDVEAIDMETSAALARLRDDPQYILDHWEAYLKKAKADSLRSYAQRFVKATRWHQNIPIKFAERCLKDIAERTYDCEDSIIILAVLLEGSVFANIIEPLLPKSSKIETKNKNSEEDYRLIRGIPQGMNITNPPVSLNFILPYCDGEFLELGLVTLANACRRTSIAKIKPFTKTLVDRRVSVRKHGIRLFCLVSSIDDIKEFLIELWKTETHRSIRSVVFSKIYDIFIREPTPSTWTLMKEFIDDLKNDDNDIVSSLLNMSDIPYEYIADYIKTLFNEFEKLKKNGFNEKDIVGYIRRVISRIDDALMTFLPEDFAREVLRKYFCNPLYAKEINQEAINYTIYHYLRPENSSLESRLLFLCSLYEDVLKRYWNVPDPKRPTFYPMNNLLHNFINQLTTTLMFKPANRIIIMKAILDSYLAVLKPEQDYVSYALLTLTVALGNIVEPKLMAIKINGTLPRLIQDLSPEMITQLTIPVKEVIECRMDRHERTSAMYTFIETLCKTGNIHSCIIASTLLFCDDKAAFEERHNKIVKSLLKIKHPAVSSIVNHHVNTTSISD